LSNPLVYHTRAGLAEFRNFRGCSTRPEYWWYVLGVCIIKVISDLTLPLVPFSALVSIPLNIWLLAAGVAILTRRVRDAGGDVRLVIISCLLPFVGGLAVFVPLGPDVMFAIFWGSMVLSVIFGLILFVYTLLPSDF
jgi:uncharacterized membrane protein YhaH (DUF805 family)